MLGSGTELDPYQIATAEDLDAVRNDLAAYYVQTADIDLSGYENWEPIGTSYAAPFTGSYDRNGYKISNLTINRPGSEDLGLFCNIETTLPMKVKVENADITGSAYVGVIAGNADCSLEDCSATGVLHFDEVGNGLYFGGLAGLIYVTQNATINKCWADVDVDGGADSEIFAGRSGGLFGGVFVDDCIISISECFAEGDVICPDFEADVEVHYAWCCGGLIGVICGWEGVFIEDCYATGDVICPMYSGGLIGLNGMQNQPLENCYSMGLVAIPDGYIEGYHSDDSATNGGLCGAYDDWDITSCYYDSETSGQSDNDGRGVPLTTAQMKEQLSYSNWDFESLWEINGNYPTLRWAVTVFPLQTGKDYALVVPFKGGTMKFGGKEYKFVRMLQEFEKEQHAVAGVSRTYEYGGPTVIYNQQPYAYLASGITDPTAEGGFGSYTADTKRTVVSLADRENFVNFYYLYPMLAQVEKPIWVKKVITWKDVVGATAYEVKLYLDDETQCIDTQLVAPGVQRVDYTYFIETFMPPGSYYCTVQAMAAEVVTKIINWTDKEGALSYEVKLVDVKGTVVFSDAVALGVQTYDFTSQIPSLPAGTYYGFAIPVME